MAYSTTIDPTITQPRLKTSTLARSKIYKDRLANGLCPYPWMTREEFNDMLNDAVKNSLEEPGYSSNSIKAKYLRRNHATGV